MRKKVIVGAFVTFLCLVVFVMGISLYFLDFALRPQIASDAAKKELNGILESDTPMSYWVDSLVQNKALKDTFILAPDGVQLHAYYAYSPQPTPKTAIIIHGYGGNAVGMFNIGYMFHHELQYNILLPDLRYAGLSEGDAVQMGWLDRKDIVQWIQEVPALFGDSIQIAVQGISMGGATTMMTSGEQLPESVKCFIEDCGYTSVWDEFAKELKVNFNLPVFPLLHLTSMMCKIQNGWGFKEASALEQVKKCKKPMLFIHGSEDEYVPTWMVYKLYQVKSAPKELWITPGVAHGTSYTIYPSEYTKVVKMFTDKYIF